VFHDPFGWWVREAGEPPELPPLTGAVDADVVVVGGGYLGMWTAWHLLERDPGVRVVIVERDRCGFGPSGRNGGFVTSYWNKLPSMVSSFGEAGAVELARAAEAAVVAIGSWCSAQDVDAWYRRAGEVEIATSAAQEGEWLEGVDAALSLAPPREYTALSASEVASRVQSPCVGGGAFMRTAATVQPARLAFGLRERLVGRGVRVFERSRVTRVAGSSISVAGGGSVSAGRVVLAVNHVAGALRPFRGKVSTASSHIVMTPPVPGVLEEVGWTGGEALRDCRTMLHYFRTTRDDRVVFGWGGGRMGFGTRRRGVLDVDPEAAARAAAALRRFFPGLTDVPLAAAWGGPIDVSAMRFPQYRSVGRAVAGFGFTGNGVGPSYLGGQILSGMALDARDSYTALPLVEPNAPTFPPEPLRFAGGTAIRAAMVRADDDADRGAASPSPVRWVAGLPTRLGMNLPR